MEVQKIDEAALLREAQQLMRDIEDDNDPRDQWLSGRWPMLHRIYARLHAIRRGDSP